MTVVEGNADSRTVTIPVTLSEPLAARLTVRFATANGTATKPDDYKGKTGSVSHRRRQGLERRSP